MESGNKEGLKEDGKRKQGKSDGLLDPAVRKDAKSGWERLALTDLFRAKVSFRL